MLTAALRKDHPVYHDFLVLDGHAHLPLPFGANAFFMLMQGTGRTSDDLVPEIRSFYFLSEQDKIKVFSQNPTRAIPALGQIR
jgi:hypothetical protein